MLTSDETKLSEDEYWQVNICLHIAYYELVQCQNSMDRSDRTRVSTALRNK
jgi:hypothetical protein